MRSGPRPAVATVTDMLFTLGIVALLIALAGALALVTGRQLDSAGVEDESVGGVARLVDGGLRRTGQAVDELLVARTEVEATPVPRPAPATYAVVGAGLVGLALVLLGGVALFAV